MKKSIGIIFGGQSVEHEVSIITGLQVAENINRANYDLVLIYIDKSGRWFHGDKLKNVEIYKDWKGKGVKEFFPSLNKKDKKNVLLKLDAAIIATHGNFGEDGKLQGLLEFMNVPYTSPGVVGSAAGMDKIVMKKVFAGLNLPVLPYVWFTREEWEKDRQEIINKVHYTLDYPVFIKPANLGSSIGISMAKDEASLAEAIEVAAGYDVRILVEKGITNPVEVNCSGLMSKGEVLTSELEEPAHWEEFLSFNDKYIRGNNKAGKGGMSNMARKIPAEVNDDIKEHIINYTKEIYRTMDCNGVVRIDFILNSDKSKVYVNEINTIPGSFSFYLWEPAGIKFGELLDIIIEEAIKTNKARGANILRYDSTILDNVGKGAKGAKR